MKLKELKELFEKHPSTMPVKFRLSEPFSWRGIYAEVAFTIEPVPSTIQDSLDNIEQAYTKAFLGWKGGIFEYDGDTPVNFESDPGRWSDGHYLHEMFINLLIAQ